ncbi:hypothetical protein Taro_056849 [Colocasia esculenta]|uniref:Uncharacterized protein n=1 Tax=Colocasia esculenta TaxID=4460 RepID=A0A843XXX4_COLES|nr:hypothetical protein [Colocasia esculenta]
MEGPSLSVRTRSPLAPSRAVVAPPPRSSAVRRNLSNSARRTRSGYRSCWSLTGCARPTPGPSLAPSSRIAACRRDASPPPAGCGGPQPQRTVRVASAASCCQRAAASASWRHRATSAASGRRRSSTISASRVVIRARAVLSSCSCNIIKILSEITKEAKKTGASK